MQFLQNSLNLDYLTILLSIVFVLIVFFIIIYFLKQKYDNKFYALQTEAVFKIKALDEKLNLSQKAFETQKEQYEEKIDLQDKHFDKNIQNIIEKYELKISNLKDIFNQKEENFTEKIELLENSKNQMKLEFESLSNKIFEENQKKSNLNLNQVLDGFKGQLELFGKRVNEIYSDETKQRVSLLSEIKNLKELNNKISQDAINLTKALKGENKTQGDWGEMILSSILEQTGLQEGREYEVQGSFTDENGKRLRPDVIVHLPNKKDIIIDSKVSLKSYLHYNQAQEEVQKELALKELIKSIQIHIKGLSSKRYENLEGVKTLDFVLMFIPVESAYILATSKDANLFKMAFENNIMLVSPSTLYVTLRTIENIWRNEHQNENAQIISKKAADLYDKFTNFVKDLEDIGANISRANKSYESAMNKLSSGKGNLLNRSQEFLELGVKPKKQLKRDI